MELNRVYGTYQKHWFCLTLRERVSVEGGSFVFDDATVLIVVSEPTQSENGWWKYNVEIVMEEELETAIKHFRKLLDWGLA